MVSECAAAYACIVVGIVCLFGGCFIGYDIGKTYYRQQAIERGFAEYDAKTGQWRWKGE